MSFGIIAAMEAADNEVSSDATEVEQAETATAVAQETPEVLEAAGEVTEVTDNVDAAVEAGEELEEIGEVAQAAVDSGEGLSEDAAAIATIAVERIHEKLFGTRQQRIIPAKESFGSTNSRLAATESIVDSVRETIVRIWKGIKQFAIRLWDKVKQFIAKLFSSTKMTAKHIENLRARVGKLDASFDTNNAPFSNGGVSKAITVAGRADLASFAKLTENAEKLSEVAGKLSVERGELSIELQKLVKSGNGLDSAAALAKAVVAEDGYIAKAEGAVSSALTDVTSVAKTTVEGGVTADANTDVSYSGPFAGNSVLCVVITKKDGKRSGIKVSMKGTKAKAAEKVEPLTKANMLGVLDKCESLNNGIASYETVRKNSEKINKSIETLADDIVNGIAAVGKSDKNDAAVQELLAKVKKSTNEAFSLINSVTSVFPAITVRTIGAGVDYVSANIAANKPAKK